MPRMSLQWISFLLRVPSKSCLRFSFECTLTLRHALATAAPLYLWYGSHCPLNYKITIVYRLFLHIGGIRKTNFKYHNKRALPNIEGNAPSNLLDYSYMYFFNFIPTSIHNINDTVIFPRHHLGIIIRSC